MSWRFVCAAIWKWESAVTSRSGVTYVVKTLGTYSEKKKYAWNINTGLAKWKIKFSFLDISYEVKGWLSF